MYKKVLIGMVLAMVLMVSIAFADVIVPEDILISPNPNAEWKNPFKDVTEKDWFYDAVKYVNEKELFNGVTEDEFAPNTKVTRAMVVTALWRLDGQKYANYFMQFDDVESSKWYTEAIRWAAAEKIVTGYDDKTFGVDDYITREQFATIIYRYVQKQGGGFKGSWMFLLDFEDRANVSDWAYEAVCWCSMNKIIEGTEDKMFNPQETATRAEVATMIMRLGK